MSEQKLPLQVWVHLTSGVTRNLLQLSSMPEQQLVVRKQLKQARQAGVDGIMVPISWRLVAPFTPEQADDAHSWLAYQQLFELIRTEGLKIVADFSFVARGLNDVRYMNLLPDWLWGRLQAELPLDMPVDSLKYLDQHGRDSITALSLWADKVTLPYFSQLMEGFALHMSSFAPHICHIQLGVGPEGEWRYPFLGHYAEGDGAVYLPCYSSLALAHLHKSMVEKYGNTSAWQLAWKLPELPGVSQLKAVVEKIASLLQEGVVDQSTTDFCHWYHDCLIAYGNKMLSLADRVFQSQWHDATIGLRLSGSLPQLSARQPRIAEVIAGVVSAPDCDRGLDMQETLSRLVPEFLRQRLRLMLTGVGIRHGEASPYLMGQWAKAANALSIRLIAENRQSLALDDHPQWDHLIRSVLEQPAFSGWAIRDLDVLLSAGVGESRLRQLTRLRHGQGQVSSLVNKSFRVMGPLHLKVSNQRHLLSEAEWDTFAEEVRVLRRMGVSAISTDLWWGLVEGRQAGLFDWSYYDRLVELLARHDMHWVPILSFHQAGGNVNDDFMQTIPLWLWGKLLELHPELGSVRDLQYVSETGDTSMEYVSLWADSYVMPYYKSFISAFRDHFAGWTHLIDEVNLSLGPAGELRYPSYNAHDWGNYPNRGTLQCYSPLAEQDWRRYVKEKYQSIEALNYAFGTRHGSFDEISMPIADHLFDNKEYVYSAWAREFLCWYHGSLVAHGRRIVEMALALFEGQTWQNIPLGIKIPGIHWEISDPHSPRVAEITAGLIKPHPTLGPHNQREYVQLLDGLIPQAHRSRIALHFTCLEMINKDYEGYSRAADLVGWFADAAHELGIGLMGENALAGELYGEQGWRQMASALRRSPGYGGLTLLRMQNFFEENRTPRERLQWLINQFQ